MLVFLLFVSSTLVLTVPLPLFAFLVLVSFTILALNSTSSKALLALVDLKLYFGAIVQIRCRALRKDNVLAGYIEAPFLCFSIGCSCNTHELDILVGDDKPIPVLACEELHRTCVDGFLVYFSVVALAGNFLSTWKF